MGLQVDIGRSWRWLRPRVLPAFLVVLAVAMLVWIAVRALEPTGPTASEYALVVVASSVLNVAGGVGFARIGHAQPTHARSAVRRLLGIGRDMAIAQDLLRPGVAGAAAVSVDSPNVEAADVLLGSMSHSLVDAIQDWEDVHRAALQEVLEADRSVGGEQELQ